MSKWARLQMMCMKDRALHQKIDILYRNSSFPYKFRSFFAEWIEAKNWQLDLKTEEGGRHSQRLYEELLLEIKLASEKMQAAQNFDLEKIMGFNQAKEAFKREFDGNSCRFVEEVRACLEEEESLMYLPDESDKRKKMEVSRATENREIKQKLDNLRHKFLAAESALRDLEVQQNEFLKHYRILLAQIQNLDMQLTMGNLQDAQRNELINMKNNLENDKEQLVLTSLDRRNAMVDTHIRLAIEEAHILQLIWQEISKWQLEQKQMITGLVQPQKGRLECLDRTCEQGGEMLYRMIQQVEQLLNILNKVNYQDDRKKQQILILLKELTNDYLPMHLKKAFVIELNIPDRILKVSSGKTTNFSMAVRILGGKAFGLDFSKPRAKMALFFEKDIPAGDNYTPGACDIVNGDEKVFTIHHTTNACVAQFYSIQLHNVKRPDRGRNEELVTDQKFAFVFFTTITICNNPIPLKVVSLPVILTSQTSQEIMAKGTLIWDAAFSDEVRVPFQYRETASWNEVAAVLNALFLQNTGRGLTEDHLNYLAKMAFREKKSLNFSDMRITEKQLIKDKLSQRDFSFWKWFWANLNLVKDRIKREWQEGSVYGFISKEDVKNKLMDLEPGTFLLRFSETNIEVSQRSDVSGYLTLSFVERDPNTGQKKLFHVKDYLTPKEILDKGLPTILSAMEVVDYMNKNQKKHLLCYLWPNKPFEEVFSAYLPKPDSGGMIDDYIKGRYTIEIFLTDRGQNRRPRQDSTDNASSPSSPQSSSQFSPMNPPPSTITETTTMDDFPHDFADDNQSQIEIPIQQSRQPHDRPIGTVIPQFQFSGIATGFQQPLTHGAFGHSNIEYPPQSPQSPSSFADLHEIAGIDLDSMSSLTIDSDGDLVMRNVPR